MFEGFEIYNKEIKQSIRLNKSGHLFFSSGFITKNNLQEKHFVNIYIKKDEMKIGLEFIDIREKGPATRKLSGWKGKKSQCNIPIKTVLNRVGFVVTEAMGFDTSKIADNKIILDLKNPLSE